ncbi:MAG: amino acid permease [Kiritimatiellae bacterium]|nr:amino acid permease [Kiritimatiellia bacterium]
MPGVQETGGRESLGRQLRLLDVFAISSGAMISSGLFILPGLAHARAGPAVIFSYLIAGLLAMTGMLSIAELATAMPRAGGDYFFTTRSMGPAVGTVSGLLTWLSITLKSSFALVGMSVFTAMLVPVDMRIPGALFCLFFMWINFIGVKQAGRMQAALVIALLVLMAAYTAVGFGQINVDHFRPFAPRGVAAVFSTAGFVFVSYGGILKTASVAEEVRNPGLVIPRGLITSLLVVTLLYVAMVLVTSGVVPASELDLSLTPISDGAARILGRPGMLAMAVAAMLAFISTANAGLMAASRYLLAMSRDQLLPRHFAWVHVRRRTPYVAILATGAVMLVSIFLPLNELVKAASAVLIFTYILANMSLIILRESGLQNYLPVFRAPLYPWLQIAGIAGFALLVVEMGAAALQLSAVLMAGGLFVYWFYGRIKSTREYALLHLVERVTARELTSGTLENELKAIIRERDDIVADRFDHIVESCPVLDLPGPLALDDFFGRAAEALAPELSHDAAEILNRLTERERESPTAISQAVALPHIVVDGPKGFTLLMARCRDGIHFSSEAPGVRAVFVLAGTLDDRNFHLRSLASIAQIVQDPAFERRWLAARDVQGLRDVVLLGKRRREIA